MSQGADGDGAHRTVEYRRVNHRLRSGFTFTHLPDGTGIEVTGVCPGCGGRTGTVWEYGMPVGTKGLFRRRAQDAGPPSGPRTMLCDCGQEHAERPADALNRGCGAYWQVELP